MANEYTISKIKLPNGDVCNLKDTWRSISDAVNSSSSDVSASSKAVKSAYDLASAKVSKSGDTITGNLTLKPATGKGGEIELAASTAETTLNGIVLDNYYGDFRIFGSPSIDGVTKTGTGTPLVIDPYDKTITGDYTITGNLTGTATNVTGTVAIDHGGTGATSAAEARTNLGLGSMATETASDYVPKKWRTTYTKGTTPSTSSVSYYATETVYQTGTGTASSDRLFIKYGAISTTGKNDYIISTNKYISGSTAISELRIGYDESDTARIASNGSIYTTLELRAGSSDRTAESRAQVLTNSGGLYMYSTGNSSGNGNRGLAVTAHGTGTAKSFITIDTNNNISFLNGAWNGSTIGVETGGTGTSTAPTQGGVIYGSSATAYASTTAGTSGQFLKSNGTSAPSWANIKTSDINPIFTKTYSDYTVTENDANDGVIYFGTVTLNNTSNYYAPWWVHYTIDVSTSTTQCQGFYDVWVGYCGDQARYQIFNHFYSTSYYPIYHHRVLAPKSGYSAQGAHLGIRIQSAYNATSLARTYKINILETYGCSVAFKDSLVTYASLYNATYYSSGEMSGVGTGLQETGDADSWGHYISLGTKRVNTGAVGLGRYTLFMEDADGKFQSITSTFNNTGTGHVLNSNAEFKLNRPVYFWNISTDIAANNNTDTHGNATVTQNNVDLRYSTNCGTTLVAREPVYLVGTYNIYNDSFKLRSSPANSWWTQTEPASEDGFIYIYLGTAYDTYHIALEADNPIYWYNNGCFRKFDSIIPIERGGTGATTYDEAWHSMSIRQDDYVHLDKESHIVIPGIISGSTNILLFTIYLGRPIDYSCLAETYGYVYLRGASGYLNSRSDPWQVTDKETTGTLPTGAAKLTATTTIIDYQLGIINIQLDRTGSYADTAFTSVTNNSPITMCGVPYDASNTESGLYIHFYWNGIVSN